MTDVERWFYVVGVGTCTMLAVSAAWAALCWIVDRQRHRRERDAAIAALIRAGRISSHWFVVETKGRG